MSDAPKKNYFARKSLEVLLGESFGLVFQDAGREVLEFFR